MEQLIGPIGRVLLTVLTIAALALVTRQLRLFIEDEAMSVFEAHDAERAERPRLLVEVPEAAPVRNAIAPVKLDRRGAALSVHRLWVCSPVEPKAPATSVAAPIGI